MKSAFITFTIYSDGNFTSCENKNRFISKRGSSKSQVVRIKNNLMHYPGQRGWLWTEGKQSCKYCELSLQGPWLWALGTLFQGPDLHLLSTAVLKLCLQEECIYCPWLPVSFFLFTKHCIESTWLLINSFQNKELSRVSLLGFLFCTQYSCCSGVFGKNYLSKK